MRPAAADVSQSVAPSGTSVAATKTSASRVRRLTRGSAFLQIGQAERPAVEQPAWLRTARGPAENLDQPRDVDAGVADDAELIARIFRREDRAGRKKAGPAGSCDRSMVRLSRHQFSVACAERCDTERRDSGRSPIFVTENLLFPDVVAQRKPRHRPGVRHHGIREPAKSSDLPDKRHRSAVLQAFQRLAGQKIQVRTRRSEENRHPDGPSVAAVTQDATARAHPGRQRR